MTGMVHGSREIKQSQIGVTRSINHFVLKWRLIMRVRFISFILIFCLLLSIQGGFADGRIIRFAGRYCLIDTDVGIGKIGDKAKVYRLTAQNGLVEVGEIRLVKFANGKAAGRILKTRRGANLEVEDIVKPPPLTSNVETTRCISAGIAVPYASLSGDFDGTKIARESDSPMYDAPFYVPEIKSHMGIKGWIQTGIGDNSARLEGLRLSYQYSWHDGSWTNPQGKFKRGYLGDEGLQEISNIRMQYHKATFSGLFNLYHNERIQILPSIGLSWEIVQLQNALIDRVEFYEYGEENPQVITITDNGEYEPYYSSSPHRWLSTSVLGVDLGCDALYFFRPNLALDLGLQYNVYSNLIGGSGQVIQADGSVQNSLGMHAFNISIGLAYFLDMDKLIP